MNTCVACGKYVPEGKQICWICERDPCAAATNKHDQDKEKGSIMKRDLNADMTRLAKDQCDKDLSDELLLEEYGVEIRKQLLDAGRLGLELRYGVTFVESNIAKEWLTRAIQAEKQVADLENQIDVLSTTLNMYCSPYYEIKERAEKTEALVQEFAKALESMIPRYSNKQLQVELEDVMKSKKLLEKIKEDDIND